MKKMADKTPEELVEQIRRLQDLLDAERSGKNASRDALAKRCADYRKAARLANARADEAERKLRIMTRAHAEAFGVLAPGEAP